MSKSLLQETLEYYFDSRDFNGLPLMGNASNADKTAAIRLVKDGLIQVVSDKDYPNPHIRPWSSKRSTEDQIECIKKLDENAFSIVLYPTPQALKSYKSKKRYPGMPYRQEMGRGKGTLELAFFRFDILEQYRNDPRFDFSYWDFGARASIGSEAYDDTGEPEGDKTHIEHIGFAYDISEYSPSNPSSPVIRRVAAFYGDLADLSATHQQRWRTYEVSDKNLKPHPAWFMSQMGHFPDGIGPFERLFYELGNINELFTGAFGKPLFKTSDRPNDFGWILRASQHEWDSFIHQLDKLLSDNMDHKALTATGIPRKDSKGRDSGSLFRLEQFFRKTGLTKEQSKSVVEPMRNVRAARQKPAHELRKNITDKTFVHKQISLLEEVNNSLHRARVWLQGHPTNKGWEPRHDDVHNYRM